VQFKMAMTKNVRRFLAAIRELTERSIGVEGMGLLWGHPGEGKSTTVAYATNKLDGIYLRAMANWTVTSLLGALVVELGLAPHRCRAPMVSGAVERLMEHPRPIFVDEADYLLRQADMLDTMRDIYDTTGSPVILIGMEEMARKVQTNGRFARRITQWVEFDGINAADTRVLADTVCEIGVADDLLAYIHKAARANIGRMTTALARIETFGRINGHGGAVDDNPVRLSDWGKRALFYDQPRFRRR
jgi:DNA transposition AAA+ family ATPase